MPAQKERTAERSTVMSDVRNKNNQENLKLQKRISDYDKEMLLLVKGMDFEKLDLCEFLKNLKSCDSDKLSEFKGIQDEIRRTQLTGTPVPASLAKAFVASISNITGTPAIKLPQLLTSEKESAMSRGTASPTKSLRADPHEQLEHLPDVSKSIKDKTLNFLYKNAQAYNRNQAAQGGGKQQPRVAWDKTNNKQNTKDTNTDNAVSNDSDKNMARANTLPFVVKPAQKPKSADKKVAPKSIVQRKRRTGALVLKRQKSRTISFEEEKPNGESLLPAQHIIEQRNANTPVDPRDIPPRGFATSTPTHVSRENSNLSQGRGTLNSRGDSRNEKRKKKDKNLDGGKGLESNQMMTKAASVFAMQARFYAEDDSDALDLTLGLPARSPGIPPLDIETIREDEEYKSPKMQTPKPITPVRTPKPLRRKHTFYDLVVEMNKEKPIFSRQTSAVESNTTRSVPPSASTRTPASAGATRRTNPLGNRKSVKVKVTLPMLLSMGMGTLSDPRVERYRSIEFAPNSVHVRNSSPDHMRKSTTRVKRMSRHVRDGDDVTDDDSDYSDSNYYDSDDSYDMKLLSHRRKRKKMLRKPLQERINYLFDDIHYFTTEKPPKKTLNFMTKASVYL